MSGSIYKSKFIRRRGIVVYVFLTIFVLFFSNDSVAYSEGLNHLFEWFMVRMISVNYVGIKIV